MVVQTPVLPKKKERKEGRKEQTHSTHSSYHSLEFVGSYITILCTTILIPFLYIESRPKGRRH
jgi:hypothetical protein